MHRHLTQIQCMLLYRSIYYIYIYIGLYDNVYRICVKCLWLLELGVIYHKMSYCTVESRLLKKSTFVWNYLKISSCMPILWPGLQYIHARSFTHAWQIDNIVTRTSCKVVYHGIQGIHKVLNFKSPQWHWPMYKRHGHYMQYRIYGDHLSQILFGIHS